VGVGAVVINSQNEILCVRELRRNYMPWKTPTGLTEVGESLDEAAIREVLEETGIQTTFHSVLSFRQKHGLAHNRSDMFFVCRLDPIESVDASGNKVIPEPVAQECEIETVAWVPYKEYRDMVMHPDKGHPMMQQVLRVMEAHQKIEKAVVESVIPGRKPNDVYFPAVEMEERDLC
jgi:ADP-ribose pyrophosphatase YjhB (NUDIX family)